MAMDMLEHEALTVGAEITARNTEKLFGLGPNEGHELTKSFLLKKMEIDFACLGALEISIGDMLAAIYMLVFDNTSSKSAPIDTPAESFDARIDDRQAHQGIIWGRDFIMSEGLLDTTNGVGAHGTNFQMKTTKTFPKGFRLDKDEIYEWKIFNPHVIALNIHRFVHLRVRYWGIYIE